MVVKQSNRREFLKTSGAAAAAALSWNASSYAAIVGANDRVRVGLIGPGDRAKGALVPAFVDNAKDLNFELGIRYGQFTSNDYKGIKVWKGVIRSNSVKFKFKQCDLNETGK